MILILEDDADRERFQMGHPFNDEFFDHATMRIPTVWISTEAYEEKIRADEREKVCAYIRDDVERLTGKMIHRNHVLFLLDGIDGGSDE